MPLHICRDSPADQLAPSIGTLTDSGYTSPWVDAVRDKEGAWHLPEYACEIEGLQPGDPKQGKWSPGHFADGVDNKDLDERSQVREWGGMKLWDGDRPPRNWDINRYPENIQALMKVPHMPGQPAKETFARMKALDPRPFEDKYFGEVLRDLPLGWQSYQQRAVYGESFGMRSAADAGSEEQERELVPSAYRTPRPDTVTVCIGSAGQDPEAAVDDLGEFEYDYLELLYVRDQEGRLIQTVPFPSHGIYPCTFHSFSFVPPKGTTLITPHAKFKLRGVWAGRSLQWDREVGIEGEDLPADHPARPQRGALPPARSEKPKPVLWSARSWEGNAAIARGWDERLRRDSERVDDNQVEPQALLN